MKKIYKKFKELQEKIMNVDKKAVKVALSVSLLFVLVWVIYAFHINDFSIMYKNIMLDVIKLETEQESEKISANFDKTCTIIGNVARSTSNIAEGNPNGEFSSMMHAVMSMSDYENVIVIDLDGNVHTIDGQTIVDYNTQQFTDLCSPSVEYVCFNNEDSLFLDVPGFGIIAPIKEGNKVIGYLCGFEKYEDVIQESVLRKDLVHDEIILDQNGAVLVQVYDDGTVAAPKQEVLFFERCRANMSADNFNEFIEKYNESIDYGVPGLDEKYTAGEKETFIFYPILSTDGWSVMHCYTEEVITSQMNRIRVMAMVIFAIIVIIMMLTAGIIIRYLNGEKQRLNEFAYLDGLTGAYNRNAFVERAEKVLKENSNLPYYMICFDVVNFRIINETYGHERSDNIIMEMAKSCQDAFGHNEVYGRLTADVFVALTLDDGEENERIKYIESMVVEEAKRHYINHPIKIKRGRYEINDINESINGMIDKANIARKSVNLNGTKLSCQYSEDLMNAAKKIEEIESSMEAALANGEFKPYIQAKYNMVENHVSGGEALVRWIKPDGRVVPPGDFIPLFEQNGFVEKIDFYILEEICKYLRRMIDENREVYKISVNQSRYLMNDPEYVNKVKDIILKYQIPIGLIELELTETVFFHEKERMIKMMNDLKTMNVDLSIDDFGSGYSSFNILKDVPFDVLKIDREFLTDSVHTKKGTWILKEIIEMAHGLGMSVICEGVETKDQIELLVSLHCHYAQGFYYSRPLPMEEFIEKYNPVKDN